MQSKAATVSQYLAELPPDRREAIQAVRKVMLDNFDEGIEELMSYGMIGYGIPHSVYPPGYHCDPKQPLPFAGLASQKQAMSLYLMCAYYHKDIEREIREGFAKAGKKLDMGKCCIRFKKAEDLPLDVIAKVIKKSKVKPFIAHYESLLTRGGGVRPRADRQQPATKGSKAAVKKTGKKIAKKAGKAAAKRA